MYCLCCVVLCCECMYACVACCLWCFLHPSRHFQVRFESRYNDFLFHSVDVLVMMDVVKIKEDGEKEVRLFAGREGEA